MRSLDRPPQYRSRPKNWVAPTENFDSKNMSARIYDEEVAGAPTTYAGRTRGGGAGKFEGPDRSILGPVG